MRFRFLGDVDCQDWLLAEIYALSQMPASKIKILANIVMRSMIEEKLDEDTMTKLSEDSKIEMGKLKAVVAALEMIFSSSARNNASPGDLSSELQQLGLPREHSSIISMLHTDNLGSLTAILSGESLRLNRLSSVEVTPSDSSVPFAKVEFKIKNLGDKEQQTTINIPKDRLSELITELKSVRSLMEEYIQ